MDPFGDGVLKCSGEQYDPLGIFKGKRVGDEMDFFAKNGKEKFPANDIKKDCTEGFGVLQKNELSFNTGLNLLTMTTASDKSTFFEDRTSQMAEGCKRKREELAALQAELHRMNVENQQLRAMIGQMKDDFCALQMHFVAIIQRQQNQRPVIDSTDSKETLHVPTILMKGKSQIEEAKEERQFMDLHYMDDIGKIDDLSVSKSEEQRSRGFCTSPGNIVESMDYHNNGSPKIGGKVPLDRKRSAGTAGHDNGDSSRNGGNSENSEQRSHGWIPNKIAKFNTSKDNADEVQEQHIKYMISKARVQVKAQSHLSMPVTSDGCQWRKYGQKLAKGNPCPRAYFRCTMSSGCPVRKQVQRCAEDRTVIMSTYEGYHNHALPPAALAMASTTSSAVSMLLSGSMSSADRLISSNLFSNNTASRPQTFATLSASAPFPTITLDLTQNPTSNPSQQTSCPYSSSLSYSRQIDVPQLSPNSIQKHPLTADTANAAAATISSDPNFITALVTAITSIFGNVHIDNNVGNDSLTTGNTIENNNT